MSAYQPPRRRKVPRHAQLHLPPFSGAEADLVVRVLERAIDALWRAHGDAIADHRGLLGTEMPRPSDALWSCSATPDDDFPF